MKKTMLFLAVFLLTITFSVSGQKAAIDKAAPDFTLTDSKGETHSLSDFKGKYVVLEWINYDCPFVEKHYDAGNMQKLQETYTGKDIVWLSICSSVDGKQGNFTPEEINKRSEAHGAKFTAYLMDTDGKVGKMYAAKTTPHMYVVNPEGTLVYAGAIDDKASTDKADIKDAKNYVAAALDAAMAGKEIKEKVTKPYGCSVKY
ncbi:MAG: thioredoxin family protein [Melioribacteraceae bacterium]|nr:MAG: thioredoxin family protein [Melioribacteraceae bacterium]